MDYKLGTVELRKKRGTAECAGNTATGQRNCVTVADNKLLPILLEVTNGSFSSYFFFLFEMTKLMQSGVKKSDNTLNS